jgi:hypothetical protein
MKPPFLLALLLAVATTVPAAGQAAWTYVPASVASRTWGAFDVAGAPNEGVVSLVRASPTTKTEEVSPPRVFAVDIPLLQEEPGIAAPSGKPADCTVPAGARWPDSHDRIAGPTVGQVAGIRNPWEVRIHASPVSTDTLIACGGILTGGDGGPVCILNGRVVKPGDSVGKFSVAGILADGVLLAKGGSTFVIPRGTRTTIATFDY